MPWEGVTVSEQRERFLQDYQLNYYRIADLAERFSISRKTAYKWIDRFEENGRNGFQELSRRPNSCPWETDEKVKDEVVDLRKKHPNWGPKKLLDLLKRQQKISDIPSVATVARVLARKGLSRSKRRYRRVHPGCPRGVPQGPNDIWGADYKGQFRLGDSRYCFPQTVSDLYSRYLLGCDGHERVNYIQTKQHFDRLFRTYGLPNRIRTDNGVPFASNALARLSHLSVWFIKLGIYPELIEPGKPQQNGVHERMHRTLKHDATIPPSHGMVGQQRRFDRFQKEYNQERPHEALGMKTPAEVYYQSPRIMPERIETYSYPDNYLVRRVSRCGTIRVFHNQVFVSQTLDEDYVGLEEVDDGVYDLYFCFYQIGRYELRKNRIYEILSKVPVSRRLADIVTKV
jgi:putative transposase